VREEAEKDSRIQPFAKSPGLDSLLRFLVEQAIARGLLSRVTIASRVFGRSGNFAPRLTLWYRAVAPPRSALLEFTRRKGVPVR